MHAVGLLKDMLGAKDVNYVFGIGDGAGGSGWRSSCE